MNNDVEKIKERLNIVDVIGDYVVLQKAGKNMRGLSPFTNEKSPSFFVSPDRQLFHCFSSGKGGDVFTFVQEVEGVDFSGSLKILADRAGVTLTHKKGESREKYDKLYKILDEATSFYEMNLLENKDAMKYLESRGVTKETIQDWRLGYAPNEWRKTLEHLKSKGYSEQDIKLVGLIKVTENDKGKRFYDTFRNRIMFPLFDTTGRVIAYSGRILAKDTDAPKYVNSPETPLFNKSEVLYGLDKAKTSIRRQDYAVLVEGQMDVVMSHQSGVKNTVASSGTALTELQLGKLKRYSSRLIVAFDSDRAGFAASAKNAEMGMKVGFDVKVAPIPKDSDPADMLEEGLEGYKEVLANSQHIVDFYVDRILEEEKDKRTIARRIRVEVLPLIVNVKSSIEKAHFVQRVSERTNLPEDAVWDDFKELGKTPAPEYTRRNESTDEPSVNNISRRDSIIKELYSILAWQKDVEDKLISIEDFEKRMKDILGDEEFLTKSEEYSGLTQEFIFEAEIKYGDAEQFLVTVEDLFASLGVEYIRDQFTKTMKDLALAEKEGDAERSSTLLAKCQELTEKLAKYNSGE